MKNIDKIAISVTLILSLSLYGQYVEYGKTPPKIENTIGVIIINDAVLCNEENFKSMVNNQGDSRLALGNYWGPFFALGLKNYGTYNNPAFIGTFETTGFLSVTMNNVTVAIPKNDFISSYPGYDFYLILYSIVTNNGERTSERWHGGGGSFHGGGFMAGGSYRQVYREPYLSAKANYTIYKLKTNTIISYGTTDGMVQCGDKIAESGDIGSLFEDVFSNNSSNEYGTGSGYRYADTYRAWNLLPQELIANIFKNR